VNQRAAEGKDVEKNLKNFIREREVALERIKAQHEEQLETLREKYEDEKELMQQQREEEIEAVRRNANSKLDSIIITKNRESVPTKFFNVRPWKGNADSIDIDLRCCDGSELRTPVTGGLRVMG